MRTCLAVLLIEAAYILSAIALGTLFGWLFN